MQWPVVPIQLSFAPPAQITKLRHWLSDGLDCKFTVRALFSVFIFFKILFWFIAIPFY